MVIGGLSILAGIYFVANGEEFQDYFFAIFIGASLLGTGYFNNQEWKKKQTKEKPDS